MLARRAWKSLAVGAGGNFLVSTVGRQPYLQVVGLGSGESDVAGAQADHAIRQAQELQNVLGVGNHGLQVVVAFLGLGVLHHFNLVELVHADEAARVATRRCRPLRGSTA